MLARFLPREGKFFDLFKQSADLLLEGATEFCAMLNDIKKAESYARNIKNIENRADEVTHKTIELLHTTFITPLDREDIHQLITRMDDILDFIEAASQRIFLFGIDEAPPYSKDLAEICLKSAESIKIAVNSLEDLKNPQVIIKHCVEINRLENEADHMLRKAIAELFEKEPDIRKLIKYKEICELLETVTDRCEDVANIVEGIVLEYA